MTQDASGNSHEGKPTMENVHDRPQSPYEPPVIQEAGGFAGVTHGPGLGGDPDTFTYYFDFGN